MNIYLLMSAPRWPNTPVHSLSRRMHSAFIRRQMTFYWRPGSAGNVTQIMQFFRHKFNSFLVRLVMNRFSLLYIFHRTYISFSVVHIGEKMPMAVIELNNVYYSAISDYEILKLKTVSFFCCNLLQSV